MDTHKASFVLTFTLFVSGLLITNAVYRSTLNNELGTVQNVGVTANTSIESCPVHTEVFVNEITTSGETVPVQNPQYIKGFADEIHIQSDSEYLIPFTYDREVGTRYQNIANARSFVWPAEDNDIYTKPAFTYTELVYDSSVYEIVDNSIVECSKLNEDDEGESVNAGEVNSLCTNLKPQDRSNLATIDTIFMDCNMKLKFGWIVKKKDVITVSAQGTQPILSQQCDINNDTSCNSIDLFIVLENYGQKGRNLQGDVDKDNRINARDYSIVREGIIVGN